MLTYYVATKDDTQFSTDLPWYRESFISANPEGVSQLPESADFIVLFEKYLNPYDKYPFELLDCPFVSRYVSKLFVINHHDVAWPLLRGCYTSLGRQFSNSQYYHPICYPSIYNWEVENFRVEDLEIDHPKWLCSFRGSLTSHPLRKSISDLLANEEKVKIVDASASWYAHSEQQQRDFIREIRESYFVLCPRGNSPSSYRLFETMALERCPVIISDDWWEPNEIDWKQCSIRVQESEIGGLMEVLVARRDEALTLGRNARLIWEAHFKNVVKFRHYYTLMSELIKEKTGPFSDLKSLFTYWNSFQFRYLLGRSLPQRVMRRMREVLRLI